MLLLSIHQFCIVQLLTIILYYDVVELIVDLYLHLTKRYTYLNLVCRRGFLALQGGCSNFYRNQSPEVKHILCLGGMQLTLEYINYRSLVTVTDSLQRWI